MESLYSSVTSLDHGNLSLRHNRDLDGLVDELREWNLRFECVDDVLNVRVRNLSRLLLRLNDQYLNGPLGD